MPKNSFKGHLYKITTDITTEQFEFVKDYAKKNLQSQADVYRKALNKFIREIKTEKE